MQYNINPKAEEYIDDSKKLFFYLFYIHFNESYS